MKFLPAVRRGHQDTGVFLRREKARDHPALASRREVAVSLPGPVEFCVLDRREDVHRLTRCARRMGWPPDPRRQA